MNNKNLLFLVSSFLFFCFILIAKSYAKQDFTINWGGRIQADYLSLAKQDSLQHRDGFEVRRARLYLSGDLISNWDYKAQYDFSGDGEWKDLYIGYSGFANSYIQVGQIFEMVGLEGYTSSKNLTFIERSLPVAFVPDRALGASLVHWSKNWMFATGVYGQNLRDSNKNTQGFSSRLAWSTQEQQQTWHLGLSFAYRKPDQQTYRVRTRPESHVTDTRLIDTQALVGVEQYQTLGFELAWLKGPFSIQHEYMQQQIEREHKSSATIDSWYFSTSYFLTGESRNYNQQYGAFSSIKPIQPKGAFELALRYSEMNLNDKDILGGQIKNWTLGLNWYYSVKLKFALNYIDSKATKQALIDRPNLLQLRVQYLF